MRSATFDSFYESYFGDPYMAWHDGLDVNSLLSLEGEEREEAERLLLAGVASGDYRPAAGLAALRSQKAAPSLKEQLHEATGDARVQTALALWQIEEYRPAMFALINELHTGAHWGVRLNAARALKNVQTPESEAALWKAIDDPEDLVRTRAAESLAELHGVEIEVWELHPLSVSFMSPNKEVREKAVEELKRLINSSA